MKFLRLGICTLVAFGIAAHGGVEDWARAVLEAGAGLLFLAWAVWFYLHREEQPVSSPLLPPLIAFALVVAGQWLFRTTASGYNTRIEWLLLDSRVVTRRDRKSTRLNSSHQIISYAVFCL